MQACLSVYVCVRVCVWVSVHMTSLSCIVYWLSVLLPRLPPPPFLIPSLWPSRAKPSFCAESPPTNTLAVPPPPSGLVSSLFVSLHFNFSVQRVCACRRIHVYVRVLVRGCVRSISPALHRRAYLSLSHSSCFVARVSSRDLGAQGGLLRC